MKTVKSLQTYNYGIDLVKLIMAVCIIAIHTEPLNWCDSLLVNSIYEAIVRQAVPFFFVSGGYLLFSKFDALLSSQRNIERTKKYLYKNIKMYIVWHIIYLPITLCGVYAYNQSITGMMLKYIFVGEQWLSWPLWYLLSTIYALVFLFICIKSKMGEKTIYLLAFLIYIGVLILPSILDFGAQYTDILRLPGKIFNENLGGGRVFRGIGCITIGMFLARNGTMNSKKKYVSIWVIATMLLIFLKATGAGRINVLIEIICGTCLFLLAQCFSGTEKIERYIVFRKASTVFYYTHMIWVFIYNLLSANPFEKVVIGPYSFFFALILSAVTSIIVYRFKEKRVFKVLFF